jgi:hypothetical protein
MPIRQIYGFETGDGSEVFSLPTGATVQSSVAKDGGYALRTETSTATSLTAQAVYADRIPQYTIAFWFRKQANPSSNIAMAVLSNWAGSGGSSLLQILLTPTGTLGFGASTAGSSFGSSTIPDNTWVRIVVRVDTSITNAKAWINGTLEFDSSSFASTVDGLRQIQLRGDGTSAIPYYFDDIIVRDDLTDIPEMKIAAVPAGAVGAYTAWALGAGASKLAAVSEMPPNGDTSYVNTSTNNNRDSYTPATLSSQGVSGTIHCVRPVAITRKISNAVFWRPGLRVGTTDYYDVAAADGATTYETRGAVYATNPATSAAWTVSEIEAAQSIVQHQQSQARELRCTWTGFMVAYTAGSTVPNGTGQIAAVGTMLGTGQRITSGSGPVAAVASLLGTGVIVASGTSQIAAVSTLVGIGEVPGIAAAGSGEIDAVSVIDGVGYASMYGSGEIGAASSLVGIGEAPTIALPNAPTSLVAMANSGNVSLTWDRVADGAVIEVWRRC